MATSILNDTEYGALGILFSQGIKFKELGQNHLHARGGNA